jgi:DNA-binding NarL/FixJ family response regulator
LRQGLRQLLADENPDYEFAEADGFDAALAALADGGDLLLIDLGMPGMVGAESLRALREAYPDTKVAVITARTTGRRYWSASVRACMATS